MTRNGLSYKKAGVDMELGDACSGIAYREAQKTFPSRRGMIGQALNMEGGFTGAQDMGGFYMVSNCDTVGTKMVVAEMTGRYDTIANDLIAMVADDAVCSGAETIAITNTIMTNALSQKIVGEMMKGLSKICKKQKIIIPGGEIAELKDVVNGYEWGATAVGIVEKKKMITGRGIRVGDKVIGLYSPNFRSNGFTLLRAILKKKYGASWHHKKFRGKTWGALALAPSVVYSAAVLSLIGRFGKKPAVHVKGIAHITGGGLPGNAPRMLDEKKFGLLLDNLPVPPAAMLELQRLGNISDREVYKTWNMGVGMALIAANTKKVLHLLHKAGVKASVVGEVTKELGIKIKTSGGKMIKFG